MWRLLMIFQVADVRWIMCHKPNLQKQPGLFDGHTPDDQPPL